MTEGKGAECCPDCGTALVGEHCHSCGQRARLERLDLRSLGRDFLDSLFNVESRLWRTVFGLTRRPGRLAREYTHGRRSRLVGPFRYFVVSLLLLALADWGERRLLGVDEGGGGGLPRWIRDALHLETSWSLLATLPLVGVFLGIAFRASGTNLTERLVLALYAFGHGALFLGVARVVLALAAGVVPPTPLLAVAGLAYCAWAARDYFQTTWLRAIFATWLVSHVWWFTNLLLMDFVRVAIVGG